MAGKRCLLGFDSGTQSVKALIFDLGGNVLGEGRAPHQTVAPKPGWAEQNPVQWWDVFCISVKEALSEAGIAPGDVESVGMAHQRSTICAVDEDGAPLAPAQVWYDDRALRQVRRVGRRLGATSYMRITGRMPNTNLFAVKAMWIRDEQPEVFRRAYKLLTVGGYFVHRLTGGFRESYASPTGLLDMARFEYSEKVLEALEMPREKLCPLSRPGDVVGYITRAAALETSLEEGTPVAAGAGDQQASGLGCGVVEPGTGYLNLGTSVVLGTVSTRYVFGRRFIVREGLIPGTWNPEGLLNSGYWLVTWFKEKIRPGSEEALDEGASRVPAGSLGLVVQPYWLGVGQPYWDANARGTAVGWGEAHTWAHFYRAILEGLAYDIRLNMEAIEEATTPIHGVRVCGGGARSSLSCRIVADVLGRPVGRIHTAEAAALGASMLAAAAARLHPGVVAAAKAMSRVSLPFAPDEKSHRAYNHLYNKVYKRLYPSVRRLMGEIAHSRGSTAGNY